MNDSTKVGQCPICGSTDIEANAWEAWCYGCDGRWAKDEYPAIYAALRSAEVDRRASWTRFDCEGARRALGLSVNQMADALISPHTGRPWKASRISECEAGRRYMPTWGVDQIRIWENLRDEVIDQIVTTAVGNPGMPIIIYATNANLWAEHPAYQLYRFPAATYHLAAAFACAKIAKTTGERPSLITLV
ncbi:MAG: hypothetical protein FWF25_06180 [Propionibacteriaceae bacterium]|nr:hypothetical protein [Propionibacteriaceae bacterium]